MSTAIRTFFFTDIEGSSRLWEQHPEAMPCALATHDDIVRYAVENHNGQIFKTVGDAVCAVFDTPIDGLRAAMMAQQALARTDWEKLGLSRSLTVRMALMMGEAEELAGDFAGPVLNRISRLLRAGHGGQVLVAQSVASELLSNPLAGVHLRDLGERRLRDIPGAQRIYQLDIDELRNSFPPLETLEPAIHNLPAMLDIFLDRETAMAEIRHLLLDTPTRLVTLLGPGGIGKTRLAMQAAWGLVDSFPDGIWFVDLSGARDADSIPAVVAAVLETQTTQRDPMSIITERLGDQRVLLILDNCEQIAEGAAQFVSALLPRGTDTRVLVTSRAPLHIRGEQRIEIGPLPVEQDDRAGPAVHLFLERARQHRPAFALTETNQEAIFSICHRVDGIPLALELAAARVTVLTPEVLRDRLSPPLSVLTSSNRDLPERHRTLRNAIEWSYALLAEEEQRAFRVLSVFRGGWSFAAAQAVLELDESATMEMLASLHDKSLVRRSETGDGESRYAMLETIREFGYDQLTDRGESDVVRSAHTAFFAQLAERSVGFLEGGPRQQYLLGVFDREISNFRTAIQNSLDAGDAETAVGLSINLWYYWSMRGLMEEGQRWLSTGLTLAAEADQALRARAANARQSLRRARRGDGSRTAVS